LRAQIATNDKRRVQSAAIRISLDAQVTGRKFSAQEISRWLIARGWTVGKDGYGMRFYTAPETFIDITDKIVTLPTNNPFNYERTK
jgi:hypothetical protein